VNHRKKIRELRFYQENVMNEFGAQCLPYPGKGSTISDIVRWFDEEIKAIPATFAKANRNFAYYAIVGVHQMLQDSGCEHLSRLQSLASSCDASLLDDLPPELMKLACCLVRKWWVEHGLPEASNCLRREPEVIISSMPYDVLVFHVLMFVQFMCCWVPNADGGGQEDRGH
jgi:hypothetical protein